MRRTLLVATAAWLWCASAAGAQATHLVVISGLGGEPAYEDAFHETASAMLDAARRLGVPAENLLYLAEDPTRDPGRIAGRSTRAEIESALRGLARRVAPGDAVYVLLIGHGSAGRDGEPALNLPGPDLSGSGLAALLDGFSEQRVAVVNAASASGGFVPILSGEGRVVITATRSTRERDRPRFAEHFVEAYSGQGADVDKDGRISLLEAFDYAKREVERAYESESALQTEHALLDDDGDGEGSLAPEPATGDGALAARLYLPVVPTAAAGGAEDPELAALYSRKRELEDRIAELRSVKSELDSLDYARRLEDLLVELALTDREIREREGDS